jgi:hypothetical protein
MWTLRSWNQSKTAMPKEEKERREEPPSKYPIPEYHF